MGQFKPMVKMETTEPSVILKLKKGGHVSGHSSMDCETPMEESNEKHAVAGKAPGKPSMSERRKAMSGAMLNSKKGGKVAKKADGGMMGAPMGAAPMGAGAMMNPAMKKALMMRMLAQRAAQQRPAMAAPAPGMGAPNMPAMKKGGMAKGGDMAQDKAMIKKAFMQHDMQEHEGGKGTKLKLKHGGTTKVVDGDKMDKAGGTGVIKMGKPAGYKKGGMVMVEKNGKMVPDFAADGVGKMKKGGMATGGVRMANAGGFKDGGSTDWANRPANGTPPGKTNTKTGEVKEANAGGFKKGGAAKKHFATGGSVNDTGHAVAMPRKSVSRPIANSLQSGTFKKGGKVSKFQVGGTTDMSNGAYDRSMGPDADDMDMAHSIRRLLGIESAPKPTQKQSIHAGGYKKGGNAKC